MNKYFMEKRKYECFINIGKDTSLPKKQENADLKHSKIWLHFCQISKNLKIALINVGRDME